MSPSPDEDVVRQLPINKYTAKWSVGGCSGCQAEYPFEVSTKVADGEKRSYSVDSRSENQEGEESGSHSNL